jgi:hypothetical protein
MESPSSAHVDTVAADGFLRADQWAAFEFNLFDLQFPDRCEDASALDDEPASGRAPAGSHRSTRRPWPPPPAERTEA